MKEFSPDVKSVIEENEKLRKLLNLKQSGRFSRIICASTITISPWVFPSVITIDKGTRDGIRENMAIVSYKGSLIGRITSVKENTSTGITLYHPDSKISVMVAETGELAVMEGFSMSVLSPHLRIKFLPTECMASAGDTVETSGLTKLYPSRIRIGKIIKIDSSRTEPVTHGIVEPFFTNENLRAVAVVE